MLLVLTLKEKVIIKVNGLGSLLEGMLAGIYIEL